MPIELSHDAHDDLVGIYTWIAREDPQAARGVIARIYDAMGRLRMLPYLSRHGRATGTRELVVARLPYIVVFRIETGRMIIEAVMPSSQSQ